MQRQPAVFLSSTFFDLRQVRADLCQFIEEQLGYRFLASEHESFPVDPSVDTIENCRRRVETDADIFVLVIGTRYGSVPKGAHQSVTNLEYLTARAKSIPIFAFVQRDVLALLPLWQTNPMADFTMAVDTPALFEFVTEVRATDRVWSFPFDTAQDILKTLRIQFAFEMMRGLSLSARLRDRPTELRELSGEAFRIAVEKPPGWPFLLLARLIENELSALDHRKRDHERGLVWGSGEQVAEFEMPNWIAGNLSEGDRIGHQLARLCEVLDQAANALDISSLTYGAQRVAAGYAAALDWSNRLRGAHIPIDWQPPVQELSRFLDPAIEEVGKFPQALRSEIARLIEAPSQTNGRVKVTINIDELAAERYREEMKRLRRKRGLPID